MKSSLVVSLTAVACCLAAPLAAQTEAEPVIYDEAEALAMDAKLYAAEFGVSFDEALERLTVMHYGDEIIATAVSGEGGEFAGRYFDNKAAEFGLTVATKANSRSARSLTFTPRTKTNYGRMNAAAMQERNAVRKAARQAARLSDQEVRRAQDKLSKPMQVRVKYATGKAFSLDELEQGLNAATAEASKYSTFTASSIDEAGNTVRVFLTDISDQAAIRAIERSTLVPVAIEHLPGGFVPVANMRGGSKLYSSSSATSSSSRSCMTAFGAKSNTLKNSSGQPMTRMITAAHCSASPFVIADDGKNKALTTPSGHSSDTRGSTNQTDIRFVYSSTQDPVGLGTFYFDGTSSLRSVASVQTRAGTTAGNGTHSTVGTTTGSYICHLGQTSFGSTSSMQSCGEVISTTARQTPSTTQPGSFDLSYTGGAFVMVRNTSSGKGTILGSTGTGTLRCYQGDSGGPWFAGTVAYGSMSSCAWENGGLNTNRAILSLYTSLDFVGMAGASIIVP